MPSNRQPLQKRMMTQYTVIWMCQQTSLAYKVLLSRTVGLLWRHPNDHTCTIEHVIIQPRGDHHHPVYFNTRPSQVSATFHAQACSGCRGHNVGLCDRHLLRKLRPKRPRWVSEYVEGVESIMASGYGNMFCLTDSLWWEPIAHWCIHSQRVKSC